ncbi:hypothetical protein T12_10812 [Trichinella patagoniensis]|uniref:Uncharacterized protein n=1 Tax=Trichinella patagoniensis TaxID=990121 RepID=A0A0V0Z8K0_9BILA|nr:hypothetical protein T12_10812 [Trichinella patagoniensis]
MTKDRSESINELKKMSMNQLAGTDMKHEPNKGSKIEQSDSDAQGALKVVLPSEEQNVNKEKGIEEASLITAVDVASKNINKSDTVSGEEKYVEMPSSIEESASLQGSSITAEGMSSTSDVDSKSTSGEIGIVENEHLDKEKRFGPLNFIDGDSESLKGEEVRKASQEVAIIEAEEVFEKASWSIDISENTTSDIKVSNALQEIGIFEHKQFDDEQFLKSLVPDDDFSQRSSYDSNFTNTNSIYSQIYSSSLGTYDVFGSVSSSIEDSVIDDSVPTYSQNFGISACSYLSGISNLRENSFLDFGSQTAESSEDATTASEGILLEEKASEQEPTEGIASEVDEDGKRDSTDVLTVEAQYVQEMKVSEGATTMIANCQNEKSAKKANAASEKLGIPKETVCDNQNVLVRNSWLRNILLTYAIDYAFAVFIFFLCLRIINGWSLLLMFYMNALLWLNEDLHFQK